MIPISDLKVRLLAHIDKTTGLSLSEELTPNQKIYFRAISLHTIIKDIDELKEASRDFPKILYAPYHEKDNVQFEPLLIRNLLRTNISCLHKLLLLIENRDTQNSHFAEVHALITSELEAAHNELKEVLLLLDRKPDILSKSFSSKTNKNTSKKPKVSIITTSFNLASLVEETILSVENQDYENIEHIVIDGASTDGSLEIIKKHKNIILVSEKDSGCADAIEKGVRLATGKYVLLCFVSDGFASPLWVSKCVEMLEANKDISLVWGLSCGINNDSKMIEMTYPEFHYAKAPEKEKFFDHWLKTLFHYPEINLCVRRSVLVKHFPSPEECIQLVVEGCLEFVYRFNTEGYLSAHIPTVASFYHIHHAGQIGDINEKSGQSRKTRKSYEKKSKAYKWQLMLGKKKHVFIDENGNILPIQWNRGKFIKEYITDKKKHIIGRLRNHIQKYIITKISQ